MRYRTLVLCAWLIAAAITCPPLHVSADVVEYGLVDVHADLPGGTTEEAFESEALGVNENREVVGWYVPDENDDPRAFIWLPQPAYGLTAGGHDLNDLLAITQEVSTAHALNERGQIAGQYDGRPVVWDLSTWDPNDPNSSFEFIDIGALNSDAQGVAYDVSDEMPAVVVGTLTGTYECIHVPVQGDPECDESIIDRAFQSVLDSTVTIDILHLSPLGDSALIESEALGVAGNSALHPGAVGCIGSYHTFDDPDPIPPNCALDPVCPNHVIQETCDPIQFTDAPGFYATAEWSTTSRTDLGPFTAQTRQAAVDINQHGQIVGWEEHCPGYPSLPLRVDATFRESPTSPVDLLPVEPHPDDEAEAKAIRDASTASNPEIVGLNTDRDFALRWRRNGAANWNAVVLNGTISTSCQQIWDLVDASDVSPKGWIVGLGEVNSNDERAYALNPCPADMTFDGCVGGADLGLLLAAWDSTGCHPADLDGDGMVDGADLGLLLSAWNNCPGYTHCDEGDAPEFDETNSGDYEAVFFWLVENGEPGLALQFADVTGLTIE